MKKWLSILWWPYCIIVRQQQPPKCQTYCPDCSQHWVFRIQSNKSSLKVKSMINHWNYFCLILVSYLTDEKLFWKSFCAITWLVIINPSINMEIISYIANYNSCSESDMSWPQFVFSFPYMNGEYFTVI